MKALTKLLSVAALGLMASGVVQAQDVGVDEVLRLREAGKIVDLQTLNQAALALHPGAIIEDSDLDLELGRYIYELELRDSAGVEWDVDFDAATGEMLRNQRDD